MYFLNFYFQLLGFVSVLIIILCIDDLSHVSSHYFIFICILPSIFVSQTIEESIDF
jgi:hypothetical protein